jgi:hypothetical protein
LKDWNDLRRIRYRILFDARPVHPRGRFHLDDTVERRRMTLPAISRRLIDELAKHDKAGSCTFPSLYPLLVPEPDHSPVDIPRASFIIPD